MKKLIIVLAILLFVGVVGAEEHADFTVRTLTPEKDCAQQCAQQWADYFCFVLDGKGEKEKPKCLNPWEVIDDEKIRLLAKAGEICRVLGHKWEFVWGDIKYPKELKKSKADVETSTRRCVICDKVEIKYIKEEWR